MADMESGPKHLASQENLLLSYMQRLEENKGDHMAVHLHLSSLKPYNRRAHHIRAAENGFENLIKSLNGQLFMIKNSDMFFFFKNEARAQTETAVQKVRFLFSDDPLLENEEADENRFSTWYDVGQQFGDLLHLIESMIETEDKRKKETRARMDTRTSLKVRQKEGEPITPEILARVESALERADLSNLVRRQFVCTVDAQMIPEQSFSEVFISIADLRETMVPGINLVSNRWLFQHMTESLDRRMLSLLSKNDALAISGDISFNANVTTLLSRGFQDFDDNIMASRRGSMIIELQKVDIFADLSAYLFAREFVQDKGYRVCLDGLTHNTMGMVERERLGADLVKLVWHSDMVDGGPDMHEKVRTVVKRANPSKVIMCRVDTREAVDFGQSVGIKMFQGHFIENLIAEDARRRELLRLKRRMERAEQGPENAVEEF